MEPHSDDILNKCQIVTASIKKNLHLLNVSNPDEIDIDSLVAFNNRIVLSACMEFLEAVRKDVGGEIIEDSYIGSFLYFGDERS